MSRLANWLYALSDRVARWRNREARVVVGPGGPELFWVKPESTDRYGWDETHYHKGQVNVAGVYNPVHLTAEDLTEDNPEVDVIPSENYKAAMVANEIIPKALAPMDMDQLKMYIMAGAALSGLALIAVAGLYTQVGG